MEAWIEVKVLYDSENKSIAADMISGIFFDMGLQGVTLEDPEYEAVDGWTDSSLSLPAQYAVIGYLPRDERLADRCIFLEEKLEQVRFNMDINYRMEYREITSQDWAETWKTNFVPQQVTPGITIKPSWHEYQATSDEIIVEIDPGMAFGTGSHPTTQLCISMIETYLKKGNTFLDIGTGSGILLIIAAKLGAGKGLGIDIDRTALDCAEKNLALNKIDASAFEIRYETFIQSIRNRWDIIVANILPDVILSLLNDIHQVLAPQGIFICSGFLDQHMDKIIERMISMHFVVLEERIRESWVAIAARMNSKH